MMQEDNKAAETTKKTEDITLGLGPLDVDDYNVNDGVSGYDEPEDSGKGKRRWPGYLAAFVLGALFCLGVILLGAKALGTSHIVSDADYDYYNELAETYGKHYVIMKMIGEDPIAETEPDELSDEQLKELVASIGDPYAEYYTPAEYEMLRKRYDGNYVGIGIGIVQEDDKIVIKTIFEDTPAEEGGLKEEDVILKVDGKTPSDVDEAVAMISGTAGTKVTITVQRGDETLDFTLNREKIDTDSVAYAVVEDHPEIGYINIGSFIDGTADEFRDAVKDLESKGCEKFIVDLRNNGGGLTDQCIDIADYLLPACRIMSENTKDGKETVYNSKAGSADLDMVVLVNENTASASEILTAALQDNGAAKIIGNVTYGKGVTQTLHEFADGSAVKITATEYFRPSGETVNEVGITPDIDTGEEDALEVALEELTK